MLGIELSGSRNCCFASLRTARYVRSQLVSAYTSGSHIYALLQPERHASLWPECADDLRAWPHTSEWLVSGQPHGKQARLRSGRWPQEGEHAQLPGQMRRDCCHDGGQRLRRIDNYGSSAQRSDHNETALGDAPTPTDQTAAAPTSPRSLRARDRPACTRPTLVMRRSSREARLGEQQHEQQRHGTALNLQRRTRAGEAALIGNLDEVGRLHQR